RRGDDVSTPRHGLPRRRPARGRESLFPEGEDGGARRKAGGPRDAAGAEQPAPGRKSRTQKEAADTNEDQDPKPQVRDMRWSKYFLQTVREVPGDAEAISRSEERRVGKEWRSWRSQ